MIVEIVVCTARMGSEVRLRRLLETRAKYRGTLKGCLSSVVGEAIDGTSVLLSHSIFSDEEAWSGSSERVQKRYDARDGGLEACMSGPALVGVFEMPDLLHNSGDVA